MSQCREHGCGSDKLHLAAGRFMTSRAKELITHSRMVAFRACRRRHHYAFDLGVQAVRRSKPLIVGDTMHRWLERWFTTGEWVSPLLDSQSELTADTMEFAFAELEAVDKYEAAKLRAMVLAYHLHWHGERWTVLAVERQFRAPLTNPLTGAVSESYERGGKIDAIVSIDDPDWEGVWVVEHKSNRGPLDPEDTYWQRLRLDPQCSDYFIGARALGFEPAGIIYDVVCKPALEPLRATAPDKRKMTIGVGCSGCGGKRGTVGAGCAACEGTGWKAGEEPRWRAGTRLADETPGEYGQRCFETMMAEPHRYLHRRKVVRLEDEIDEHLIDGWYTARSMHEQRATGVAPRNPDACFLYNRPCEFWPVCSRAASIDDQRLYRITGPHPELRVVNDW